MSLDSLSEAGVPHGLTPRLIGSGNRWAIQWIVDREDYHARFMHGWHETPEKAIESERIILEVSIMGIKMYKTKLFPYIEGDQIVTNGHDVIVTMERVEVQKVTSQRGEEEEFILYFKETDKGMILNKTNVKTIIALTGSDDTEDWKGVQVALTTEHIKAFGDWHNALRVIPTHEAKKPKKSKKAKSNGTQKALIESDEPTPEMTGAYNDS